MNNKHSSPMAFIGKRKTGGFTLVEVMVALAVVAIALAGLLEGLGHYAKYYGEVRQRFWSQNIGWNELSKIVVAQEVGRLSSISANGSKTQLTANWQWKIQQEETAADTIIRLNIQVNPQKTKSGTRLTTMIMKGSGFNRSKLVDNE